MNNPPWDSDLKEELKRAYTIVDDLVVKIGVLRKEITSLVNILYE
jgi:hypothetical protein